MDTKTKHTQDGAAPELKHTDADMQAKLDERDRIHKLEVDNLRAEAQRRQAAQKAEASTEVGQYLESETQRQTAETAEREGLSQIFGPTSSGVKANDLIKTNPSLYHKLKARAVELGLLSASTPAPKYKLARGFGR
jgi:hypothetical protein